MKASPVPHATAVPSKRPESLKPGGIAKPTPEENAKTDAKREGTLGGRCETGTGGDEGITEVRESWSLLYDFWTCQSGRCHIARELAP